MNAAGDAAMLARVVLSLIVVVLLVVLAARMARRTVLRGHGRNLRVLERLPLSREAFLAVVAVADRGLVLGVTAHGVQVLSELDAPTVAQAYPAPDDAPPGRTRPFGRPRTLGQTRTLGRTRALGGTRGGDVAGVEVGADGVKVTRLNDGAAPQPPQPGTGAVLDPRTWRQAVQALREITVRRG